MPAAFYEIDGMDVVGVDYACAAEATHDLSEDETGDLAPGEVAECSQRNCDGRVNMTARNAAGDPDTEGGTCKSKVSCQRERAVKKDAVRLPTAHPKLIDR